MADKYDLVIFGSAATARVLALCLAQSHGLRVLLVFDRDQLYRLAPSPQLSAGYCTSPQFFEKVHQGAASLQRLLASQSDDHLDQTKPVSTFASNKQHLPLLEFAEGAAIHADIVCERRVHAASQSEQLVFPEARVFDSSRINRSLATNNDEHGQYGSIERAELKTSHITKDGRFSGRTEDQALKADRVLLLDQDMIHEELMAVPKATPIVPHMQQIMRFQQHKSPSLAAQQDVSTGLWQFQCTQGDLLFSASGRVDQLATHLFKHHAKIVDRRVRQIDQLRLLNAKDGYPVLDVVGARKAMCFVGAQHFELALATELGGHIAQLLSGGEMPKDTFWSHAKLNRQRGGGGALLRAQLGGAND